jgi:hypothetical protein
MRKTKTLVRPIHVVMAVAVFVTIGCSGEQRSVPSAGPPPVPGDSVHPSGCATDTDCSATSLQTSGKYQCCDLCKTTAGTIAWVRDLEASCAQRRRTDCPELYCRQSAFPPHPSCVSGICR